MRARRAHHEARCRLLRARIGAQRALLAEQIGALDRPAMMFDRARSVGVAVHDSAPLFALAASVMLLLLRGRALSRALAGWRLARRVMRALALWKIVTGFMRRHPGSAARWDARAAT